MKRPRRDGERQAQSRKRDKQVKGKRHQEKVVGKNTRCLRVVEISYVRTPDADERLSRAIEILLRSAARHAIQAKEAPNTEKQESPRQAPAEDVLTRGSGGNDSHGEG